MFSGISDLGAPKTLKLVRGSGVSIGLFVNIVKMGPKNRQKQHMVLGTDEVPSNSGLRTCSK